MSLVDVGILTVLAVFLAKGIWRGLLRELCGLLGLTAGGVLAFCYYRPLAGWAVENFGFPELACVIGAFLALFLCTMLFFSVLGRLLSRVIRIVWLGGFNRMAGGLFGLAQGVLLLAVVLFALSLRLLPATLPTMTEGAHLAPPFVRLGETVFHAGCRLFPGRWQEERSGRAGTNKD